MIGRVACMRRTAWFLGAPLGAAIAMIACSSTDAPTAADDGERDAAPGTPVDDAASTPDVDAGADAADLDAAARSYDFAVSCAATPCATQIAARGGAHACAILQGGSVRCWGANRSGQLGIGANDAGAIPPFEGAPAEVAGISNAASLTATGDGEAGTTCVVTTAGAVTCFGSDAWGQLGRGASPSSAPHPEPAELAGLEAKSVTLAGTFALAAGTDGRLWSWGTNDAQQLARATAADAGSATAPARADGVTFAPRSFAGTSTTSFVVSEAGELVSWGGGTGEALGRLSSLVRDPIPAAIALSQVSHVTAGAAHACALHRGEVHCWGKNDHGQLGSGRKVDEPLPSRVVLPEGVYAVDIAAGGADTCIIASNGAVYCWGANESGQVGPDAGVDQPTARRIEQLTDEAVGLAVMDRSVCALLRSGAVACWGDNLLGQLGRGARDAELHAPAPVVFQ